MRPFHAIPSSTASPYVIAHRGISAKAPENTLAAFLRAAGIPGIDMVELDVRLSRDEQVIVLHDRSLQRTTTGNGPARKYTLNELKTVDAGSWFHPSFSSERIPTLQEVCEAVRGKCWIDIEIKSDFLHREPPGLLEQRVLDIVRAAGCSDQVVYSSFDHQLMANVKQIQPGAATAVIYSILRDYGRMPSKLARRVGASVFVCAKQELTQTMVRDAHEHKIPLYVYTLNSTTDIQKMMNLGVQGIISDTADDVVKIIKPESAVNV